MSSAEIIPAQRTLTRVLRRQLAAKGNPVQLVVATGAATQPAGAAANAYVNIVLEGATLTVPRLRQAAAPASGAPAYLLATGDFMLYIGTVTLT